MRTVVWQARAKLWRYPGKQQSSSEGLSFSWEYHNVGTPGPSTTGRRILEKGALSHLILKEGFTHRKNTIFRPVKDSVLYLCYFYETEFVGQAAFAAGTVNTWFDTLPSSRLCAWASLGLLCEGSSWVSLGNSYESKFTLLWQDNILWFSTSHPTEMNNHLLHENNKIHKATPLHPSST